MAIRKVISRSIQDSTVAAIDLAGIANNLSLTGSPSAAAVSTTISGNATDVFVYDTRKDSDGGAWRKRCQHTSWFNETLNTATRGSRREFPAVAVIVSTSNTITIYDGDDPSLPMWMVFNEGSGKCVNTNGFSLKSVTALNGILCWAGFRLGVIRFVADNFSNYEQSFYNYSVKPLSERNGTATTWYTNSPLIISLYTNDVDMIVLPNAPIDATTGLPIPTIATATDGGISLIQNTGAIHTLSDDIASNGRSFGSVAFSGYDVFAYSTMNGTVQWFTNGALTGRNQSVSFRYNYTNNGGDVSNPTKPAILNVVSTTKVSKATGTTVAATSTSGLTLVSPVTTNANSSLMNYITSKYNTGWMPGSIRGAWLSDNTTETVISSQLASNPGPAFANTTGWYLGTDNSAGSSLSISSGRLVFTHSSTNNYWDGFGYSFPVVAGKSYTVIADVFSTTNMNVMRISINDPNQHNEQYIGTNNVGINTLSFIASASGTAYVHWNGYLTSSTMQINSVSARISDPDRSTNNKGLQVFGSVTKSAVETDAELMSYSGFSTSNYLQQPYNSSLDLGTNDMCVVGWIYNITGTSSNRGVMHRNDTSTSGGGFLLEMRSDDTLLFQTQAGGANVTNLFTSSILPTGWSQFVAIVTGSGTVLQIYINGVLNNSIAGATARSLTNTSAILRIGQETTLDRPFNGRLALMRITATVPSPEQIEKMYNEEKHLFRSGAKACLYGTSDSVSSVAYDENNQLLHVGTSSGRSLFDGLRRVENTTNSVTTAISVSNGMVAEQ